MTPHTRIYLIRHGQVAGFEEPRYNGQADVALTEYGVAQYNALKERLQDTKISVCYTSDLTRCTMGAKLISCALGVDLLQNKELRELNIGAWEGLTWQEIKSAWSDDWEARFADIVNFRVPQGENLLDVQARVMPVINNIVAKHTGEEVLVVAHGGVNRIILLNAIGAPLDKMFNIEQSYGCLNIIDYYSDGHATVKLLNG